MCKNTCGDTSTLLFNILNDYLGVQHGTVYHDGLAPAVHLILENEAHSQMPDFRIGRCGPDQGASQRGAAAGLDDADFMNPSYGLTGLGIY
jgi:hypothetical protein